MSEDQGSRCVVVVAAAILDGQRLLAAQRCTPPSLAGGWELPGGKVEAGEADQDALHRELYEELGVRVRLGRRVGGDWPLTMPGLGSAGPEAVLRVWTATLVEGVPRPLEDHAELRWLAAGRWDSVAWLPADLPVVAALGECTTTTSHGSGALEDDSVTNE